MTFGRFLTFLRRFVTVWYGLFGGVDRRFTFSRVRVATHVNGTPVHRTVNATYP